VNEAQEARAAAGRGPLRHLQVAVGIQDGLAFLRNRARRGQEAERPNELDEA